MKRFCLLLLPCLIAGCAAPSVSLPPPSPPRTAPINEPVALVSGKGATADPVDTKQFFERAINLPRQKSDFETQSDYDARISSLLQEEKEVTVLVDVDRIKYKYRAENKALLVLVDDFKWTSSGYGPDPLSEVSQFTIKREITESKDVVFQNAFGAQFEGRSSRGVDYVLSFPALKLPYNARWRLDDAASNYYVGMGATNEPARAQEIVQGRIITLAFRGKLKSIEGIQDDYRFVKATVSSPSEFAIRRLVLPFEVHEILAVDRTTNEIRLIMPVKKKD